MLKLAFDDMLAVTVVENDRGNWTAKQTDYGATILSGYGGENCVYILPMTMSDGSMDITVVHSMCDNPSKTAQSREKLGFVSSYNSYDDLLNRLIEQADVLDPFE